MAQSLDDVSADFRWSRERLWALDLPVGPVAVEDLRFHLDCPFWSFNDQPFAVSPAEVRADPSRYHLQYARTMAADLSFPLHALARQEGSLILLDGVRRLLKADLLGLATVAVKQLPIARLDEIAV
jgi:hypothetical protein